MIFDEHELIRTVGDLPRQRLHKWLRLGWVRPERREGAAVYHDVDVARARLLCELERTAEFDDETLPLILSLLDQIHGLRSELRCLALAVGEQPPHVRERVRNAYVRISDS